MASPAFRPLPIVRRHLIFAAVALITCSRAYAQAPAVRRFEPSPRLFASLFRECRGCERRPQAVHLVLDSPRLTDEWLARHTPQANGGSFGDNAAIADFWYDAVHRRLITRSLVLHEVNDPADLRLGRAPGIFPDGPAFTEALAPGTVVGLVGFVRWSSNGFGSYFAAMQGAVRDTGTGYLDLATVSGRAGRTRSGSPYESEDLVRHVRLHPSGQLEVGFDTDPGAAPDPALLVHGNVEIEGTLMVGGARVSAAAPPPSALVCTVRTTSGRGRMVAAACEPGEIATGGGGTCGAGEMRGSRPLAGTDGPHSWELTCSRDGGHTATVICCAR